MSDPSIHPEDLALFALRILSPEEMRAMQRAIREDVETRLALAEIEGDLALLALSAVTEAPPASSRERFLLQISREPRVAPKPDLRRGSATEPAMTGSAASTELRPTTSLPRRGSSAAMRTALWLGWAAAAVLAVTAGKLTQERDALRSDVASVNQRLSALDRQTALARHVLDTLQDPAAQRVTLTLSKHPPVPQGKATYNADRGTLVFLASDLQPLAPNKTYELWVIPANGQAPIAAGLFKPDQRGDASVLLPKLPVGVTAKAFGITIENDGGATAPTMPIILAGTAG